LFDSQSEHAIIEHKFLKKSPPLSYKQTTNLTSVPSNQPSNLIVKFLNGNLQWGRWCTESTGCVAVQPRPLSEAGRRTENNKIMTPFKKPFYFCPSLFLFWQNFDELLMRDFFLSLFLSFSHTHTHKTQSNEKKEI